MEEFVRICGRKDLPRVGMAREFTVAGKTVCVANVDGVMHAMDGVCPHRGGPLGEGAVEEGLLVCPWHAWSFDPVTGEARHEPGTKVIVYPLLLEGDDVLVDPRTAADEV